MSTIHEHQMTVLSEYSRGVFENAMVQRLREDFPEETRTTNDETLRAFVVAQIGKADSYGITYESDVEAYLVRSLWYGEDWDTSLDWVASILNDPIWSGSDKMFQICQHEQPVEEQGP